MQRTIFLMVRIKFHVFTSVQNPRPRLGISPRAAIRRERPYKAAAANSSTKATAPGPPVVARRVAWRRNLPRHHQPTPTTPGGTTRTLSPPANHQTKAWLRRRPPSPRPPTSPAAPSPPPLSRPTLPRRSSWSVPPPSAAAR
jgi:hypothetical protein